MRRHGFDPAARVADLEEQGRRRELRPADRVAATARFAPDPGAAMPVLEREKRLVFGSNNYLGLTTHDRVQDAVDKAATVVGTGAGSSRTATGDTMTHRDLELLLADHLGTDRVLTFSSGYAALAGTIASLQPDVVFVDERSGGPVADGADLAGATLRRYHHCDPEDLARRMEAAGEEGDPGDGWLVATPSTFGASGTNPPLSDLCDVAEAYGAWVLADESHAIGCHEGGKGRIGTGDLADRVHVQVGSLATALASQGGYVAASAALIELLASDATPFTAAAGLAPPAAAAASAALHVATHGDRRDRLWRNVTRLREGLASLGYDVRGDSQVVPVVVGDPDDAGRLARRLYDQGVLAPALTPPAVPPDTSRIRLAPMGTHSRADVESCLDAFDAAGRACGLLAR